MAHTNSTTNYNLPQFLPTDKPAWLVDVNPAYASIDTAIKNASDAAGNAQGDATQALSDAAGAQATATQANTKADGAIASLAESFLDTATYAVGEYVIFNNILYVCTEPVTTPGPWTGSVNWTRASVDSIATSLNSSVATLESKTGADIPVRSGGDSIANVIDSITPSNTVLSAAWTASGSSAYDTQLTQSITVTPGIWLIVWGHPTQNASIGAYVHGINVNSDINEAFATLDQGESQTKCSIIAKFTGNVTLDLRSGGSAAVTYTNLSRGFLRAYKLN